MLTHISPREQKCTRSAGCPKLAGHRGRCKLSSGKEDTHREKRKKIDSNNVKILTDFATSSASFADFFKFDEFVHSADDAEKEKFPKMVAGSSPSLTNVNSLRELQAKLLRNEEELKRLLESLADTVLKSKLEIVIKSIHELKHMLSIQTLNPLIDIGTVLKNNVELQFMYNIIKGFVEPYFSQRSETLAAEFSKVKNVIDMIEDCDDQDIVKILKIKRRRKKQLEIKMRLFQQNAKNFPKDIASLLPRQPSRLYPSPNTWESALSMHS